MTTDGSNLISVTSNTDAVTTYTATCVSRAQGIFKVESTELSKPAFFRVGETWSDANVSIKMTDSPRDYFNGDKFVVTTGADATTGELVPAQYLRVEGFNQLYVQYLRAYGLDKNVSINRTMFNSWDVKLGYRFDSLVNTDLLKVKVDNEVIPKTSYDVVIKENKFTKSTWLNSINVTLARMGSTVAKGSVNVPSGTPPGSDWIFHVAVQNPARPLLSWYSLDTDGEALTFMALDGSGSAYAWDRFTEKKGLNSVAAPFMIVGIQNLINFIFGYEMKLKEDGWHFNDQDNPVFDPETGRAVDYQLLVEKFIDEMFSGAKDGVSFLFNPFFRKVWFESPRGVVTALNENIGMEQETVPKLLAQDNTQIPLSDVRVFRQDEMTEFVFDRPAFTFHLLTSEYEHVALFGNYASGGQLFYDPFLGQVISNIFVEGRRQATPTGRLDFGGHYLLGGEMKRNIESSVKGISQLYETAATTADLPEVARARSSLGFQHKEYFDLRETSEQAEFRFWQGMINRKGTNFAVDAFTNSNKYKNSSMDEFWAYKIAEYGDSRRGQVPEMRIALTDVQSRTRTPYVFLEKGESGEVVDDFGFDTTPYDTGSYEYVSIYTPSQGAGVEPLFDPRNTVVVSPTDESRWMSYDDLSSLEYFELELIGEFKIVPTDTFQLIVLKDQNGHYLRADAFEIVNKATNTTYYERGQIISEDEYSAPKFVRLNRTSLYITDESLIGRTLYVRAYGPPISSFSPSQVYNYKKNVLVKDDFVWWDPARGSHHPQAIGQVDFSADADPAVYNLPSTAHRVNPLKVWGSGEVGKYWWNTALLGWQPYSDAKIYPENNARLNRWGALAEYSSIEVYEWVASDVPPEKFAGELGIDRIMTRQRTWQQRPVAWKYSANPSSSPRAFLTQAPHPIEVGAGSVTIGSGKFGDFGVTAGSKIAGATFTGSDLSTIFGTLKVTGEESPVIGSASQYTGGAVFSSSQYFSIGASLDSGTMSYVSDPTGQYTLSETTIASLSTSGTEVDIPAVTLRHVTSGKFQSLPIIDTPDKSGMSDTMFFDELGVSISYKALYGKNDSWPSIGTTTSASRAAALISALVATHEIYVRYSAPADVFIPFGAQLLGGWVAWNDPATNPVTGPLPPLNGYEAIVGDWVDVGDRLSLVHDEIDTRLADPWIWFNGDSYVPYRSSWSAWTSVRPEHRSRIYFSLGVVPGSFDSFPFEDMSFDAATSAREQFFISHFTYDLPDAELLKRGRVYINGLLLAQQFYYVAGGTFFVVEGKCIDGHTITVIVDPEPVSEDRLAFDPEKNDDPLVIAQFKKDRPYVIEERRGPGDTKSAVTYYFWAKAKESPGAGKKLSTKQVCHLLQVYDDSFCVPQVLKWADQIDGRPNRYAAIYIENLHQYVGAEDEFKVRFKSRPYLRNDDRNLNLKNVHEEWVLIRPYQSTKIPQQLWSLATDTAAGSNQIGEALPNTSLTLYEDRTGNVASIGPGRGQVLTDPQAARDVIKYVILNTEVTKFDSTGKIITDFISYPGFSMDSLTTYLSSATEVRKFMSDLWRYATAKQINEIFFAILEDGVSRNVEMPDFFKTSYVALNDIRTVSTEESTLPPADLALNRKTGLLPGSMELDDSGANLALGLGTSLLPGGMETGGSDSTMTLVTHVSSFRAIPTNVANTSGTDTSGNFQYKNWEFSSHPTAFPGTLPAEEVSNFIPGHTTWSSDSLVASGEPVVVSWYGPRSRYATTTGWSSASGGTAIAHEMAGTTIGDNLFKDSFIIWVNGTMLPLNNFYKVIAACLFCPNPTTAPDKFLVRIVTDRYPATSSNTRAIATVDLGPLGATTSGVTIAELLAAGSLYDVAVHPATNFSPTAASLGKWNMLQRPHFNKSGTKIATIINLNGVVVTDNLATGSSTTTTTIGVQMDAVTWAIDTRISTPHRTQYTSSGTTTDTQADSWKYLLGVDFYEDTLHWMTVDTTQSVTRTISTTFNRSDLNNSSQTKTVASTTSISWAVVHSSLGTIVSGSTNSNDTKYTASLTVDGIPTVSGTHHYSPVEYTRATLIGDLSRRTFAVGYTPPGSVQFEARDLTGTDNAHNGTASATYSLTVHAPRYIFDVWIDGTVAATGTTGAFTNSAAAIGTQGPFVEGFNDVAPIGSFGSPIDTTTESSGMYNAPLMKIAHCAVHSQADVAYIGAQVTPLFPDSTTGNPQSGLEISVFKSSGGTATVQNPPAYAGGTLPTMSVPVFIGPA